MTHFARYKGIALCALSSCFLCYAPSSVALDSLLPTRFPSAPIDELAVHPENLGNFLSPSESFKTGESFVETLPRHAPPCVDEETGLVDEGPITEQSYDLFLSESTIPEIFPNISPEGLSTMLVSLSSTTPSLKPHVVTDKNHPYSDTSQWDDYEFGVMIDGGSTGSRVHVYMWEKRVFDQVPPKWSTPYTRPEWSIKLKPGIAEWKDKAEKAGPSLKPLIEFAKEILKSQRHRWDEFNVFFKATGGLREVEDTKRKMILHSVRTFLEDDFNSPFKFAYSHARIISGEEEGAYAWTTVNYMMGTFLPYMEGFGAVEAKYTYGSLDLGGSSSQLGFFRPEEDILANLFKLQLGGQRHWNIYTHSFLHFGRNSAYRRWKEDIYAIALAEKQKDPVPTACLSRGHEMKYEGITFKGTGNWHQCHEEMKGLFWKNINAWCDFSHPGHCSYLGVYQPALAGQFIAFSGYKTTWANLGLQKASNLRLLRIRTRRVCNMTMEEQKIYLPFVKEDQREWTCWLGAYVFTLLHYGHYFPLDDTPITVTDSINGKEIDWVTGAMLYEVNTLPWSFTPSSKSTSFSQVSGGVSEDDSSLLTRETVILLALLVVVGALMGYVLWRRNEEGRRLGSATRTERMTLL